MSQAPLTDPFGRRIDYLRLSVTDRCDLRCGYCLPKGFKGFEEPAHWLTFEEIERVVATFTALGVRRVRLTGGQTASLSELGSQLSATRPVACRDRRVRTPGASESGDRPEARAP
ncbi:hypothetical protein Atep_11160 [Allochromatium tepidum]|uniref:Radical SAM core domain-containing protein n=1 Tax=Allochromatium tepidum TaxID=553982 RepID=A0ABM7QKZ2_9GAMM|nr:hypothetical protein Atep_11160 [Allochromatium tepidum]